MSLWTRAFANKNKCKLNVKKIMCIDHHWTACQSWFLGQHGSNFAMHAAIRIHGVLHHHALLGPYNSAHLLVFFDNLPSILNTAQARKIHAHQIHYTIIWDNVSFHHAVNIQPLFQNHPSFSMLHFPPHFPHRVGRRLITVFIGRCPYFNP